MWYFFIGDQGESSLNGIVSQSSPKKKAFTEQLVKKTCYMILCHEDKSFLQLKSFSCFDGGVEK